MGAGLDATRFTFYGFLPRKGRERDDALREIAGLPHTAVVYEAPGRVAATLAELAGCGAGGREAVVARELTKQFENIRRGTVSDLSRYYTESAPRGEVVLLVSGAPPAAPADEDTVRARARTLRAGGASARDTANTLVDEFQLARNAAYRVAQEEAPE